jgi:hypothetical protein
MSRRSAEPGFAGGDSRFADEILALEKISALLGDAHHDLRFTGNAVAVPIAGRR